MEKYVENSIELIRDFEKLALEMDSRGYCVCSSFGKDSIALIKLFQLAEVKFFVQYNITGVDPPQLSSFARIEIQRLKSEGVETLIVKPRISMRELIIKKGVPPTRLMRYCCSELKERRIPETRNCFFSFGVRKAESSNRAKREALEIVTTNIKNKIKVEIDLNEEQQLMLFNDNDDKRTQFENCTVKGIRAINPLIWWSDEQLWNFIRFNEIPYCELYENGFKRLGCIGCPMAGKKGTIELEDRFPQYKQYYIQAFDDMLEYWKEKGNPRKWETGTQVYNWWVDKEEHDINDGFVYYKIGG